MLQIRKGGHRDLERWYSMFEIDFDQKELLPKLALHRALSKGDAELLIVYDEESRLELAYALTLSRSLYGYVLLKYFGVLPWYRGKGLGVQAMRLLNKYYAEKQGILAELAVFDPEDTETLRKLRKFFSRFGYERVDCDYRLSGAEAELLVKPVKGTAEIAPVAHRILRDFYSRILSSAAMERMIDVRKQK
jgi:GNAT superfamily N-acetyltransferase